MYAPLPPLAGAIMAPYYYEGESDPADWPNQLKHPAPWGEIGSRKLVIASPAKSLRKMVDDPRRVANYWSDVSAAIAQMLHGTVVSKGFWSLILERAHLGIHCAFVASLAGCGCCGLRCGYGPRPP